MALDVNPAEEIELYDGTKVIVKPLNIKALKKFFEIFAKIDQTKTDNEGTDILTESAGFCLAQFHKDAWKSKDAGTVDMDYVEEVLTTNTIKRIIKVCAGIDFENENLIQNAVAKLTE